MEDIQSIHKLLQEILKKNQASVVIVFNVPFCNEHLEDQFKSSELTLSASPFIHNYIWSSQKDKDSKTNSNFDEYPQEICNDEVFDYVSEDFKQFRNSQLRDRI